MSVFREGLMFLDSIGIYDVVLPLLLIFSIVYAILEKTKIFGMEKAGDGKEYTRKNVNAMVAFVAGFFVVASAQLVGTIHKLVADVSVVLISFVMFMILVGVFSQDGEIELRKGYKGFFYFVALASIFLILLNALGWLMPAWFFIATSWSSQAVASFLLLALIVAFIFWVTHTKKDKKDE